MVLTPPLCFSRPQQRWEVHSSCPADRVWLWAHPSTCRHLHREVQGWPDYAGPKCGGQRCGLRGQPHGKKMHRQSQRPAAVLTDFAEPWGALGAEDRVSVCSWCWTLRSGSSAGVSAVTGASDTQSRKTRWCPVSSSCLTFLDAAPPRFILVTSVRLPSVRWVRTERVTLELRF